VCLVPLHTVPIWLFARLLRQLYSRAETFGLLSKDSLPTIKCLLDYPYKLHLLAEERIVWKKQLLLNLWTIRSYHQTLDPDYICFGYLWIPIPLPSTQSVVQPLKGFHASGYLCHNGMRSRSSILGPYPKPVWIWSNGLSYLTLRWTSSSVNMPMSIGKSLMSLYRQRSNSDGAWVLWLSY
jgi:hypothetical protein